MSFRTGVAAAKDHLETIRSIVISVAVLALSIALVIIVVESFRERRPVLRPIHIPESLDAQGFSQDVLSATILSRVSELQEEAIRSNDRSYWIGSSGSDEDRNKRHPNVAGGADPLEKLTLPGTDASLQVLVTILNRFLGTSPPVIDVGIWEAEAKSTFAFSLQYSGPKLPGSTNYLILSGASEEPRGAGAINPNMIGDIAERILWLIDPVSYARLLLYNPGALSFFPSNYRPMAGAPSDGGRDPWYENTAVELLTYCTDGGCSDPIDKAEAHVELARIALRWNENRRAIENFTQAFQVKGFAPQPVQRLDFAYALLGDDQAVKALTVLRGIRPQKEVPADGKSLYASGDSVGSPFDQLRAFPTYRYVIERASALRLSAYARSLDFRNLDVLMRDFDSSVRREGTARLDHSIAMDLQAILDRPSDAKIDLGSLDRLEAFSVLTRWSAIDRTVKLLTPRTKAQKAALSERLKYWQDIKDNEAGRPVAEKDLRARWPILLWGMEPQEQTVFMLDHLAQDAVPEARGDIRKVELLFLVRLLSREFDEMRAYDVPRLIKEYVRRVATDRQDDMRPHLEPRFARLLSRLTLWNSRPADSAGTDPLSLLAPIGTITVARGVNPLYLNQDPKARAEAFADAADRLRERCGAPLPELYMADAFVALTVGRRPIDASPGDLENYFGSAAIDTGWFNESICRPELRQSPDQIDYLLAMRAMAYSLAAKEGGSSGQADEDLAHEDDEAAISTARNIRSTPAHLLYPGVLIARGKCAEAAAWIEEQGAARTGMDGYGYSDERFLAAALLGKALHCADRDDEAIAFLRKDMEYTPYFGDSYDDRPLVLATALTETKGLPEAALVMTDAFAKQERRLPEYIEYDRQADGDIRRFLHTARRTVELLCQSGNPSAAKDILQRSLARIEGDAGGLSLSSCPADAGSQVKADR
ncbi:hypothetical protein [Dongia sp.]|uniref:hypothetical protein n=1 Tax=Dongia sp. TaxID=1977262 RepID=UPI0035AE6237